MVKPVEGFAATLWADIDRHHNHKPPVQSRAAEPIEQRVSALAQIEGAQIVLSYQHVYHAGGLGDVHKHALLAVLLDQMAQSPAPITYFETHAGRGLYDLKAGELKKTGEAEHGIERVMAQKWFPKDHAYMACLKQVKAQYGRSSYPGSPMIAKSCLRSRDKLHLLELHPGEITYLDQHLKGRGVRVHHENGLKHTFQLTPPKPAHGMMLVDPSYEVKTEYLSIAVFLKRMARRWPQGVLAAWYPILSEPRHEEMIAKMEAEIPSSLFKHEVRFAPVRKGHSLVGSGMIFINAPDSLPDQARFIGDVFSAHAH